jgi:uncharacterized protein (TIGR03067 family)
MTNTLRTRKRLALKTAAALLAITTLNPTQSSSQTLRKSTRASALVGKWIIKEVSSPFERTPAPLKDALLIISKDTLTFVEAGHSLPLRFVLDGKTSPTQIDLSYVDPTTKEVEWEMEGIVKVDGDSISICLSDVSDGSIACGPLDWMRNRPTKFSAELGELIKATRCTDVE